ncbi:hypothetical protein DERP_006781 [Dermatophagoides pteronyssinus]|uniref:Uncharacterized protein n=1 Tax=Dermatophagoides pteronyssinus TaxID=6956 RepID=A0ABQ8IS05_DERPT|nr:hypothetical protein DERP_006781 [Dermatophagoides pteronyssinus]
MFNRKFSLLSSCLTIITVICSFKLLIFADTLTTDSWNSDDAQIRAKPLNQAQYFNQLLLKQQSQKSNGFQPNTPSSLSNHDDTGVTADVIGNGIDHNELIDDISSSSLPSLVKDNGIDDTGDIRIAVKSKRRYEYVPVHYDRDDQQQTPRMIEIVSDTMPLRLHFKSQSAAIVVTQSHMSPSMKPIEETVSMDEPYRLSHKAYKPIVQDVNEIIQPYRNIVQQVKPVIENIRTIVPKDNDIHHQHQSPSSSLSNTQWNGHFQKNNNNNNNINDKINTKTYTNRFYEQQRQTSNGYRDQVKTSESQHHGIQKRTALNKNTEPDRSIHHNTRQNNFHNFIRNPRIIPNNSNDNRRKKNNHLMQLESSSLQSTYVPRIMNGKHNENDQIVGDLYKDYLMTSVNQAYLKGKDINVMPDHKPITLHYRTHAQPIVVHQTRLPGPKPEVKHTTSHEEPQRVVHEVIRPIIQEVHEIIQPYRRVVQQVQPVIEEVRTIIAKDAGKSSSGMGATNMDRGSYSSASASLPQLMSHKPNPHYQHQSVSGSNEVLRHLSPKTLQSYRKAMYEQSKSSEDDHVLPMATTNNQQNNRFIRSRVYLTPKGVPVYQSNYRPPVYLSA